MVLPSTYLSASSVNSTGLKGSWINTLQEPITLHFGFQHLHANTHIHLQTGHYEQLTSINGISFNTDNLALGLLLLHSALWNLEAVQSESQLHTNYGQSSRIVLSCHVSHCFLGSLWPYIAFHFLISLTCFSVSLCGFGGHNLGKSL